MWQEDLITAYDDGDSKSQKVDIVGTCELFWHSLVPLFLNIIIFNVIAMIRGRINIRIRSFENIICFSHIHY
jgi:hypothetical protein